jgi:hypothetical protein
MIQLNGMAHSLALVSGQLGELHQMNQKLNALAGVDQKLAKTNAALDVVGDRIIRMNGQLGSVEQRLGLLGDMASELGTVGASLSSTNAALSHVNANLRGLSALSTLPDLDRKLDSLAEVQGLLLQTNASLTTTNKGIGSMQTTLQGVSTTLGGMNERLDILTSMNDSLKFVASRIDRSLIGRRSFFGL